MKTRSLTLLLLAGATLAFAAQDSWTLARKAEVGDTYTYSQKVVLKAEDGEVEITSKLSEKITKVDKDGITSRVTEKMLKFKGGGEEIDLTDQPDTETITESVVDHQGVGLSSKSVADGKEEDADEDQNRAGNLTSFIFPEKPVQKGLSWTHEYESSKKRGTPSARMTFEAVGAESYNDKDCVKVKFVGKELEGDKPISIEGNLLVRLSDGMVVRFEAEVKNYPLEGEPIDVSVLIQMEK